MQKKSGRPRIPDDSRAVHFNIYLPRDLFDKLSEHATAEETNKSAIARKAIRRFLEGC